MTLRLFAKSMSVRLQRHLGFLLLVFFTGSGIVQDCCFAANRTVALSGDTAPNTVEVFIEGGLLPPTINNIGQVAFGAELDDLNFSQGIWSEGDGIGSLRKVVLAGDSAPGTVGASFGSASNLFINDAGDISFNAFLDDFTTTGVWTDRDRPGSTLTKIAVEGDPAPGLVAPRNFQLGFGVRGFNNSSQTAFRSSFTVAAPPNNFPSSGIHSEGLGGGLVKIAEVIDTAPGSLDIGTGLPGVFTSFGGPSINNSGHVAFLAGTNITTSVGSLGAAGVWTNSNTGALRKVALQGEAAPGTSTTFSQLFRDAAVINNSGNVAFSATLVGLIAGGLREGIWVERGGVVEKVAFESESAPGTASTFENMSDGLIDGIGHAVFQSTLADGTVGLWHENSSGTLEPVALEGQSAPGTTDNFLGILQYAINASGQVAFAAQLDDFTDGIFALDKGGTLQKIVAGGDVIQVAPGDVREVEFVSFSGLNGFIPQGGNGLSDGLSDTGDVAFYASFIDGSDGIFVSDVATLGANSADFDGDGDIDGTDFLIWQRGLGSVGQVDNSNGDANLSGTVDAADLAIWETQYGNPPPLAASVAVPVPTSALLLFTALATIAIVRRPFS